MDHRRPRPAGAAGSRSSSLGALGALGTVPTFTVQSLCSSVLLRDAHVHVHGGLLDGPPSEVTGRASLCLNSINIHDKRRTKGGSLCLTNLFIHLTLEPRWGCFCRGMFGIRGAARAEQRSITGRSIFRPKHRSSFPRPGLRLRSHSWSHVTNSQSSNQYTVYTSDMLTDNHQEPRGTPGGGGGGGALGSESEGKVRGRGVSVS